MGKPNFGAGPLNWRTAGIMVVLIFGFIFLALSPVQAERRNPMVKLTTSMGDITVELYQDKAPESVANFLAYVNAGFYGGTAFHRVIPGFMIQGGDPNSKDDNPGNDGMGGYSYKGPGTSLKAEFNSRPHTRGILSMARSQHPDSAGSQFFICHADAPFLNGKYTVFGEVVSGMDTVDKIAAVKTDPRDRPLENQVIKEVLVEEWPAAKIEEASKK